MTNKILFIVGASSDFGRELIIRYSNEYDVILAHYNKSKEELEKLQNTIGPKLHLIQADLLDETSTNEMLFLIRERYGIPTHIVHLPADKVEYSKLPKTNWDQIQKAVDLQVKSAYNILQNIIPEMAKQKYGRVVFILTSYTCDNYPPKYMLPYVTSKYMLLGMMKALAADYADKNITINAVSPSMTQTKFLQDIPKFITEQTAASHPLKRLAQVDDVVPMIQFLLSDDAGYITGQNILISGGV